MNDREITNYGWEILVNKMLKATNRQRGIYGDAYTTNFRIVYKRVMDNHHETNCRIVHNVYVNLHFQWEAYMCVCVCRRYRRRRRRFAYTQHFVDSNEVHI